MNASDINGNPTAVTTSLEPAPIFMTIGKNQWYLTQLLGTESGHFLKHKQKLSFIHTHIQTYTFAPSHPILAAFPVMPLVSAHFTKLTGP